MPAPAGHQARQARGGGGAADEYERLQKLRHLKVPSFAELLLVMPTDWQQFDASKDDCENLAPDVSARHRRPFGAPQTATATQSHALHGPGQALGEPAAHDPFLVIGGEEIHFLREHGHRLRIGAG